MPLFLNDYATGKKTMATAQGAEVLTQRLDFAVSSAMRDATGTVRANFAANDVVVMGLLPAGHVLTDVKLVSDDIDTGAGVTLSAGILNAARTGFSTDANGDGGNVSGSFIAASTVGQAGGNAGPAAAATAPWRLKPTEADRELGIVVPAIPAAIQAGTVSLIVSYRAGFHGA